MIILFIRTMDDLSFFPNTVEWKCSTPPPPLVIVVWHHLSVGDYYIMSTLAVKEIFC
jgi:hypothetical protein